MTRNRKGSAEEQEAVEQTTVAMKHRFHEFDRTIYFYEGQLAVVAGVVEIPADKSHWAGKCHILGYSKDINGVERDLAETLAIFARLNGEAPEVEADDDESAKSAEENTDEGTDGGRQPATDDGVRPSAEDGAGSLPVEGLDSGDGSGAADEGSGVVTLSDLEGLSA
jgi:hypothetical protein